MSSVTSFLRQIPTGLQYYAVPASIAQSTNVYVPVDGSSPTVVNDPAVTSYPSAVVQSSAVATAIGSLTNPILRDMGKTIKAVDTSSGNVVRYFRAYQVLVPQAATTPISPNDGVIGSTTIPLATGYAPYFTIYMPVTILGMGSFTAGLTPLAGGQM